MHFVKWLRKNNSKIMAVVVIVIMFGFVGGSYLQQLARRRSPHHETVASFGGDQEITNYDLGAAQNELEILKMLMMPTVLKNAQVPMLGIPDIHSIFLGQLLFSERASSVFVVNYVKQIINQGGYRISDKQINDIYRGSLPSNIYWLLLTREAQQAGIRQSEEQLGKLLAQIIPQITQGATYSQMIEMIVGNRKISEKQILTIFGKLMSVLEYAKSVCSNENLTLAELKHTTSRTSQPVDVEFVKLGSEVFAEGQDTPEEKQLLEQFEKYKGFFPGMVTSQNPYGFGYKLPDRVQLEYLIVRLQDVEKTVSRATAEQVEEYYQRNRKQFSENVPSAPNDPNSPLVERIRPYAEVADVISQYLLQNKVNTMAAQIIQQAKTYTEKKISGIKGEPDKLSDEQFRQLCGDYNSAAEKLTDEYAVDVYTGKTGLLSVYNIQSSPQLGGFYLKYGYSTTPLVKIAFAVDKLNATELGPFDAPKPRLYQNIGMLKNNTSKTAALVRIIQAKKAQEPEGLEHSYSAAMLDLPGSEKQKDSDSERVKEKVILDVKKLAAMPAARAATEEFVRQVARSGWQSALDEFNRLYAPQQAGNQNEPNVFALRSLNGLQRMPGSMLETLTIQNTDRAGWRLFISETEKDRLFVDRLYSLVAQDSDSLETSPFIMEFKPDMAYYCLKNVSVKRMAQQQYEAVKSSRAWQQDFVNSQSLAVVHFCPDNIVRRMGYSPDEKQAETTDGQNSNAGDEL